MRLTRCPLPEPFLKRRSSGFLNSCRVDLFKIRGEKLFVGVGELSAATLLPAEHDAARDRLAWRMGSSVAQRVAFCRRESQAQQPDPGGGGPER